MASAPPSRFTRTLLMLSGFCSLAMIPAIWVAHDDTARLGHSQLLAQTAASKTGAGLGELLSRFERVTGTLRPQDFGDTTSLSARLLRAEPQLAKDQSAGFSVDRRIADGLVDLAVARPPIDLDIECHEDPAARRPCPP